MATKTFEELKQLAIQIRDEKTNKQNTATRIGTQMLEHLDKLEQDYYDKTATDEELKERDEKLTELENKFGSIVNYIYGYYASSADGTLSYTINRCTTGYIKDVYDIILQDGFELLNIISYDLTGKFLKRLSNISEVTSDMLIRISFRKLDDSAFIGTERPISLIQLKQKDISKCIDDINTNIGNPIKYIYGYYASGADGTLKKHSFRCTTAYFQGNYDITLNDGYRIENIVAYDLTSNFLKALSLNDDKTGLLTRITFAKTYESDFNGSEHPIKSLHFIDNNIFIGTYNITDTPDSQQTTFASISVKKGSYINIKPKSDGSWDRLLIGINGNNSERLFDNMINNKDYYHYCEKEINSLWFYVVGLTSELQIELNVGLAALSKKQPQIDEYTKSIKNGLIAQFGSIVNYIYGYYVSSANGEFVASNNSNRTTTGFLSGAYNYSLNEGYSIENIVAYDLTGNFLKRLNSTTEITSDMLIRFSFKKSDDSSFLGNEKIIKSLEKKIVGTGNVLSGKSYTSLGDSFTHGDFANAGEDGNTTPDTEFNDDIYDYDLKMYKTYPWWIAKRNNMKLTNLAVNGAKLIDYANEEKLNQIPTDSDYISLKFGINDSHQSVTIGDIDSDDTTTFYGAWNYILTWLITNRQKSKIGLIASNGCDTIEYSNATVEIAKKYGLLCINEEGEEVPYFYRQTFKVQNQNIPSNIVSLRTAQYKVSPKNGHPNVEAHKFESAFIENFLRGL